MLNIFLALWLAFAGPAHHNSVDNNGHTITINADGDPGGDNGQNPPPPPPPPPH